MLKHIFKSYRGWFNSVLSLPGGGSVFCYRDIQAAAGGGGHLGDDQRAVGPHHFLPAHICAHSGRIRDSEKTEPASWFDRDQTLVKDRDHLNADILHRKCESRLLSWDVASTCLSLRLCIMFHKGCRRGHLSICASVCNHTVRLSSHQMWCWDGGLSDNCAT